MKIFQLYQKSLLNALSHIGFFESERERSKKKNLFFPGKFFCGIFVECFPLFFFFPFIPFSLFHPPFAPFFYLFFPPSLTFFFLVFLLLSFPFLFFTLKKMQERPSERRDLRSNIKIDGCGKRRTPEFTEKRKKREEARKKKKKKGTKKPKIQSPNVGMQN